MVLLVMQALLAAIMLDVPDSVQLLYDTHSRPKRYPRHETKRRVEKPATYPKTPPTGRLHTSVSAKKLNRLLREQAATRDVLSSSLTSGLPASYPGAASELNSSTSDGSEGSSAEADYVLQGERRTSSQLSSAGGQSHARQRQLHANQMYSPADIDWVEEPLQEPWLLDSHGRMRLKPPAHTPQEAAAAAEEALAADRLSSDCALRWAGQLRLCWNGASALGLVPEQEEALAAALEAKTQ